MTILAGKLVKLLKYDEVLFLADKMENEISEKLDSNVTVFIKVN